MRVSALRGYIKPGLRESEADELIKLGPAAVRWVLLELSARWKAAVGAGSEEPVTPSTPSGQIPLYTKPNKSTRGRKKAGRKAGHPGARREEPKGIDEEKEHLLESCPCCGEPLGEPFEQRTRITEDIPEVKPVITKHLINRYRCPKCKKVSEAPVGDALPKAKIGNNILALTAWMHYGLGTTINQIVNVLNVHLRFKMTPGGLVNMWRRLAEILDEWYEQICSEAKDSSTLHADETGWRVNGNTNWLWCFTNQNLTCYIIDRSRGSPALLDFLGDAFDGTLVTDFWSAYNAVACDTRQYCFAHLFREVEKIDERNSSSQWGRFRKKLMRILRDAIRLHSNCAIDDAAHESRRARLAERLSNLCALGWSDPDVVRIANRLDKYADGIFTFLDYDDVPHTNNHAERELRPAVIMRKVIQQNRSDKGAHTQAVLMSIYRTLKLRGHDPVQTIVSNLETSLLTGQLPPLPAKTLSDG
jgi:transposase